MKKDVVRWEILVMLFLVFGILACNNDDDISDDIDDVDDVDDFVDDSPDDVGTDDSNDDTTDDTGTADYNAILLIIDEESIDNGNEPNDFTETDVNDNIAEIGQRNQLNFFEKNLGTEITLYTGQVGDEGWFAIRTTPEAWDAVGPTEYGARNFLEAGPGLGGGEDDDLLDETPEIIPLRATSLAMLEGNVVIAVVYDSDISINYDPIQANLKGENLGLVAFEVLEVTARDDGSDSDLPAVRINILDVSDINSYNLYFFNNPKIPESSSEPEDVIPPENIPEISLTAAE